MGDKPILFSAPMVRAILAGTKTMTRRALKPQPVPFLIGDDKHECEVALEQMEDEPMPRIRLGRVITRQKVRWSVADRLWVKEGYALVGDNEDDIHACPDLMRHVYYRADSVQPECLKWRNAMFMPRQVSRTALVVTDVRVERLQDISEADAIAEGIEEIDSDFAGLCNNIEGSGLPNTLPNGSAAIAIYADLWDSINGPGSWHANPWVAVIEFRREIARPI